MKTKLEYSQSVDSAQMIRKVEADAIQTELESLQDEVVGEKISRAQDQKLMQEYAEQVKHDQAQSSHQV